MEAHERPSAGLVVQQLLGRPQAFNLFQAISLLEQELLRTGHPQVREAIQLRSHLSLAFEPSDIRSIEVLPLEADTDKELAAEARTYVLSTAVLGLAGAGGPLPLAFTEMLLARKAKRDHAAMDFLDIFNQRFLYFLYGSRRKHHVALGGALTQSAMVHALDSIGALGCSDARQESAPMWLRHAGLFGGAPRSMTGLLALLRDRLGLRINGRQFVGQWLHLEPAAMTRLGRTSLKSQSVLGRRVWDQSAGIELEFEALSETQLRACLPGSSVYLELQKLVKAYMRQEITVCLRLQLAVAQKKSQGLCLGNALQLGWSSWLSRGRASASEPVRLRLTGSNI